MAQDYLKIPTFSQNTDYTLKETQNELRNAIENIGLCYYEMSDIDMQLYTDIYPEVMSFFSKTLNNKSFVDKLPSLRNYQNKCINYGYVDRQNALIQLRAFVIPFENFEDGTIFMNNSDNPFKKNDKIAYYAQNMIKYAQTFFIEIMNCYLNINHKWKLDGKKEASKLMGNNPCKHLRFNYYDPLIAKQNKNILNGVHTHRDYGFITFLKPSSSGFQVKYNEKWYNIAYAENKFVVNMGKALAITTSNGIKAIPHKVPLVTKSERLSIAFFYDPDIEGNLVEYQTNGDVKYIKGFTQYFYGDMFAKQTKIDAIADALHTNDVNANKNNVVNAIDKALLFLSQTYTEIDM